MTNKYLLASLSCAVFGLVGCKSSTGPVASDPVSAQIAKGAAIYGEACASCHGDAGQGTEDGPKVVGTGALPLNAPAGAKRKVQFRTALDVFKWASVAMPGDDAGSLSAEDMVAVLAFDLSANGVKLDRPLDGALAAEIILHP